MNSSAHRAPDPVHHTILVPLDGSHFANGALPTARTLAARFGATIHTVSVAVSDFELDRIRARSGAGARHRTRRPAHPRRDRHPRRGRGPPPRCGARLVPDLPVDAWARTRRRDALGSTARDIIERGREPVVVAGPSVVDPDPARRDGDTAPRCRPSRRLRRWDARLRARPAGRRGLGPRARHEAHARDRRRALARRPCASVRHGGAITDPTKTRTSTSAVSANSGRWSRRVSTPSSSTTP